MCAQCWRTNAANERKNGGGAGGSTGAGGKNNGGASLASRAKARREDVFEVSTEEIVRAVA
jgi:hypothetical protein